MSRVYNFSPGPATLPEEVLQQAQAELLDWQNLGFSVLETNHHDPAFLAVAETAERDLRELMSIPANYHVLFLQGGARSQFSMVPLNLLHNKTTADYLNTGIWSDMAWKEASRYCQAKAVINPETTLNYTTIPDPQQWRCNPEAAYFHYADNETVNGVEFVMPPLVGNVPLVADMSSNILSRPCDVSQFGLIYASAQKNAGPAGITLVIVRDDLVGHALPLTPTMFNYQAHAKAHSIYNTPPTFAWYLCALVFQWLKRQGGLTSIAAINARKAEKLYHYIDQSTYYTNGVDKRYRSRMNVVFKLHDETRNTAFLAGAKEAGLVGLKGHKLVGGMRASIYNAMPETGIDHLIEFMTHFEKLHA